MLGLLCSMVMAGAPKNVAIMIHGAGGGGWEYRFWKPVFEKAGWQVVAPDLVPAKGGLERTSFSDYVDQVCHWVPKRHGKVVIIGASLGGILALKSAEKISPDAIVFINGVAPAGIPGIQRKPGHSPTIIQWANGPLKDTRDSMPDSDEATILWAHPQWRNESGAVVDEVRAGVKSAVPKCPMLVIIGTNDTDVPPANTRLVAAWGKADLFEYRGTSHVGPLLGTRAPEIASATLQWLTARL